MVADKRFGGASDQSESSEEPTENGKKRKGQIGGRLLSAKSQGRQRFPLAAAVTSGQGHVGVSRNVKERRAL